MSEPRLLRALRDVEAASEALPDAEPDFDVLTADERRAAHDSGVRAQDRLSRALARLVEGMARDGADLLVGRGLPAAFGAGGGDHRAGGDGPPASSSTTKDP